MVHDFAGRPLARRWPRVQLGVGGSSQRVHDDTISVLVALDELLAQVRRHDSSRTYTATRFVAFVVELSLVFLQDPAPRLPARSSARGGAPRGARAAARTRRPARPRDAAGRDPAPRWRPTRPSA